MRVIAVMPLWNAAPRLPEVLDALGGQVDGTVVVDNHSSDGGPQWIRSTRPDVLLLPLDDNHGFCVAVNRGLAEARRLGAEAVLLVNDDVVLARGAVAELCEVLADDPLAGAVSAKMLFRHRPGVLNGTGGQWLPERGWAALRGCGQADAGQYDDLLLADYPSGAASLLCSRTLEIVGGFDERFFLYFEDADWGLRASKAGWRTRYAPSAVALHIGSAGTAACPERRRYYNVRNRLLLARLHAPAGGRLRAWVETGALAARQPARLVWRRRRADAGAVLWGVADHLVGLYGRSRRYG
jgi:GT2 family glycosyltransferase